MGMFTELGIALTKYHPERTMEHLSLFYQRSNLPKMITACMEAGTERERSLLTSSSRASSDSAVSGEATVAAPAGADRLRCQCISSGRMAAIRTALAVTQKRA